MRLAKGGAAGDGGADGGCDGGVKEIDVERDMEEAIGGAYPVEEAAQGGDDALFVQHPHVADRHVVFQKPCMFGRIDRADAVKADTLRRDRGREGREGVETGAARDIGHRRAVQVAGLRRQRRVVIRMRVEPENEKRPPHGLRMGRDTGHGAKRQGMVAAHEDREAMRHRLFRPGGQRAGPGDGFGQVVDSRVGAGDVGQRPWGDVAPVVAFHPKLGQAAGNARDAEGRGTHQAAFALLAAVDGGADQNRFGSHWGNSCRFGQRMVPECEGCKRIFCRYGEEIKQTEGAKRRNGQYRPEPDFRAAPRRAGFALGTFRQPRPVAHDGAGADGPADRGG